MVTLSSVNTFTQSEDSQYLCVYKGFAFVSQIYYGKYVMRSGYGNIRVDELDEINRINI